MQAIILGVFQGIAEFLPISSSGHLAVLQKYFGIQEGNLFFTEMLHFGTLISIFIVYRDHIGIMIVDFLRLIRDTIKNKKFEIKTPYQNLAIMVIIATIPTGLIGILFKDFFESMYTGSMVRIGIFFIITGFLLWIGNNNAFGSKKEEDLSIKDALFIGLLQGFAIVPGISRSGTTIVASLLRGLNRELATEFSFLLAIPAILGAGSLGLYEAFTSAQEEVFFSFPLLLGMMLAAVVGVLAIKFLVDLLKKDKLHYFSYYLWLIGLIVILVETM